MCNTTSLLKLLCSALFIFISAYNTQATTYTVTSALDAGAGSLRSAITSANADPNTPHLIQFSLASGTTISLVTTLPAITNTTVIDGTTAIGYTSNIPGVILSCTGLAHGLRVNNAANCEIYGIQILNAVNGIYIFGDNADGFIIGASDKRNVIHSCNQYQIYIESADNGLIQNNYIGCDVTGSNGFAATGNGLTFISGADNNLIGGTQTGTGNLIAGGTSAAVRIGSYFGQASLGSSGNIFYGNKIGGTGTLAWYGWAFWIDGNSDNNIIGGVLPGEANDMQNATNGNMGNGYGNLVVGVNEIEAEGNQIRGNNMDCAFGNGIMLVPSANGGNNNIATPAITGMNANILSGTAIPGTIIDIYEGSLCNDVYGNCKASNYITTTTTDGGGIWSVDLTAFSAFNGVNVVATATTTAEGTSGFSPCYGPLVINAPVNITCNPNGNLILFTNYDGGELNIHVDVNIPNLKIGICSFEPVTVNITGAFSSNVTQVLYAGFNPTQGNNNCGFGILNTTINGVPASNYTILTQPPATISSPNGYNAGIICAYSCDMSNWQGGCNTIDQITDYFTSQLGGTLYSLNAQYCCWQPSNIYAVSSLSGACCLNTSTNTVISYTGSPYCANIAAPQNVNITGSTLGSFTAVPAGLNIDPVTGAITPLGSIAGTYQVTFTGPGCPDFTTSTTVVIDNGPSANISYPGTQFCQSGTNPIPNINGVTGGNFSSFPAGLVVQSSTGEINLAGSTPGNYSVVYSTSGICPASDTITIVIIPAINASFSYSDTLFCVTQNDPTAQLFAGASYGIFSASPSTLVFSNASNGTIDLSASAAGTYIVINTVNGSNGCAGSTANYTISIVEAPSATISYAAGTYCEGSPQVINANFSGSTGGQFSAVPAGLSINQTNGSININLSNAGNYTVTYSIANAGNCGPLSTSTSFQIAAAPNVQLTPSVTIEDGNNVTLIANGGGLYTWSTGQTGDSITVSPDSTARYCVSANLNGCVDTACTMVYVETACGELFIPNSFSPNNDANNDFQCVLGNCIESMNFNVYNRWGELVFESISQSICWDGTFKGKDCNSGVYFYTFEGRTIKGEQVFRKGNINLFR
jgi:gliding motility-associated-like protein